MPEDLKLSQIGSSQPLPPFRGLHSPGVRKHCQIIFACYFRKSLFCGSQWRIIAREARIFFILCPVALIGLPTPSRGLRPGNIVLVVTGLDDHNVLRCRADILGTNSRLGVDSHLSIYRQSLRNQCSFKGKKANKNGHNCNTSAACFIS